MSLPSFITRNWGWRLVSLGLATLVWLSLRSGVPGRLKQGGTLSFPRHEIALLGVPQAERGARLDPPVVELTVGGSPEALSRLQAEDVSVFVRPRRAGGPGPVILPVQVHAPAGITVLSLAPAVVTLISAPPPPGPAPKPKS
jgi:hypothetical protein